MSNVCICARCTTWPAAPVTSAEPVNPTTHNPAADEARAAIAEES